MRACNQSTSLEVSGCGPTTDWLTNPGTCRLRIKNYINGFIPFCAACPPGAGAIWDGTFTIYTPGAFPTYSADTVAFPQCSGFLLDPFLVTGLLFNGAGWILQVACDGGAVWRTITAQAGPIGTYAVEAGCHLSPPTITIEAYQP